ncbi:contractile injection system tape measure protein [Neolewinella antarctica]|uniref:Uncharacterized protein n=1 Tax=Neolewinella antarctica TaxID=442734 RepID=A0ABX0X733_9BACT|nr:contractile injection system tape measure protein [Neolewinella antarctica]NJC24662.1 hypothetical protein [Neolewinella antarctica]
MRHEIITQRIEWHVPNVKPAVVAGFHARLEDFQRERFLPDFAIYLDERYHTDVVKIIPRLCIEINLNGADDLEKIGPSDIRRALRDATVVEDQELRSLDPLHVAVPSPYDALVDYLQTGNLLTTYRQPSLIIIELASSWQLKLKRVIKSMNERTARFALARWNRLLREVAVSVMTKQATVITAVTEAIVAAVRNERDGVGPARAVTSTSEINGTEISDTSMSLPSTAEVNGTHEKDTPQILTKLTTLGYNLRKTPAPTDAARIYFVENAGVVLLHPYINTIRDRAGLALDDTTALANLLDQAVFAKNDVPEWERALTKLLVGLDSDEPLPAGDPLGEDHKLIVTELLDSVIEHWAKLGNTDHAGLRAGFLQRPGKLSFAGDQWVLQVEESAIDVLLDFLPWALSPVKNEAMGTPLKVIWR